MSETEPEQAAEQPKKKTRKSRGLPKDVTSVTVPAEMIAVVDADAEWQGELAPVTPNALVQLAIEKDLDIDRLGKLLDLQMRWEKENARKAFFAALSKFQSELPPILKVDKVDAAKAGKRKFASLGTINEAIRPYLYGNGLLFRFRQDQSSQGISVTCIVSHRDGYSEETALTAAADTSGGKNPIQSIGSTSTYLERYTLISALGLTTVDQDDDGEVAPAAEATAPSVKPPEPKTEMASEEQRQEMMGLMKDLFTRGAEAQEWLQQQTEGGISQLSQLTAAQIDRLVLQLVAMKTDKLTAAVTESAPAEPQQQQSPVNGQAAREQRDRIRELTVDLYGDSALAEGAKFLQSLGYGSAMSLTAIQAMDRIALLEQLILNPLVNRHDIPFDPALRSLGACRKAN